MVLKGRKHVKLISPAYVENMYPNPLGAYGRTVQSQVVFSTVETEAGESQILYDRERFPGFAQVEVWTGYIEEGDCVYIPAVRQFQRCFVAS